MTADTAASNHRVTSAVLATKLDHMAADVAALRSDFAEFRREDKAEHERLRECVDKNDSRITRNEERLKLTTGALGVLQLISATIAGWVGVSR